MGRSGGRFCSERDLKDWQCHSKTRVSFFPTAGSGGDKVSLVPTLQGAAAGTVCGCTWACQAPYRKKKKKKEQKWGETIRPSQSCGRRKKGGNLSPHEAVVTRIWMFPHGIKKMLPSDLPSALTEADPPRRNISKVGSSQQKQGEWEDNISTSKKEWEPSLLLLKCWRKKIHQAGTFVAVVV